MKAFDRTWGDIIYVHWGKSNEEMTKFFLDKLENQLETYKDKKKIVDKLKVFKKIPILFLFFGITYIYEVNFSWKIKLQLKNNL